VDARTRLYHLIYNSEFWW